MSRCVEAHLDSEIELVLRRLVHKVLHAHSRLSRAILQHVGGSIQKVRAAALGRYRSEELACHFTQGLHLDARVDLLRGLYHVDALLQEHQLPSTVEG